MSDAALPGLPASLLEPGRPAQARWLQLAPVVGTPLVSCIMPTRGTLFPARFAIDCFLGQSWAERELIVVCASPDSEVERHIAGLADSRIRFHLVEGAATVGEMRNRAIALAAGELICVWDDDDLSHPQRIARQLAAMQALDAAACFMARELLWWPARRRLAISQMRIWENTMLADRSALPPYPDVVRGGDTEVSKALRRSARLLMIDHPASYCRVYHGANLWDAEHFEMFFDAASETLADSGYDEALARLAADVPIADYARATGA